MKWIVPIVYFVIGVVSPLEVSYYELLGVNRHATQQEIRQAYKKLAIKLHPDKNPDEKEKGKFVELTEAYETLKDPVRRRSYDAYGRAPGYAHRYDPRSQTEYDTLYYHGLYKDDEHVVTLNGKEYQKFVKQEGFHFVNLYSPFCPPCQRLAPHWKELAKLYRGIVSVGAVNCKYHHNFCYNLGVGSYPTLLFYPYGSSGNYVRYRQDHSLEALEDFLLGYILRAAPLAPPPADPAAASSRLRFYVLGENRLPSSAVARIAYRLRHIAPIHVVTDDELRAKITTKEETTVAAVQGTRVVETTSLDEGTIVEDLMEIMPAPEDVDPEKFKSIRSQLREGSEERGWALSLVSGPSRRWRGAAAHHKHYHFGEINCSKHPELCLSLQCASPPCAGLLAQGGGAWLRSPLLHAQHEEHLEAFLTKALDVTNFYSLGSADLRNIMRGENGVWLICVVPESSSGFAEWTSTVELARHYRQHSTLYLGIVYCSAQTPEFCSEHARDSAVLILKNGTSTELYDGEITTKGVDEFVDLVKENGVTSVTESDILALGRGSSSGVGHTLVGFFPPRCHECARLQLQWRKLARKLRGVPVHVRWLRCTTRVGTCANVRQPVMRLYTDGETSFHAGSVAQYGDASHLASWVLQYVRTGVQHLAHEHFYSAVIDQPLRVKGERTPWLVYFHSPRCVHCHELYPDFVALIAALSRATRGGAVNCLRERALCHAQGITRYPTIKLYAYEGTRQSLSLTETIPVMDVEDMLPIVKSHLLRHDDKLGSLLESARDFQHAHLAATAAAKDEL